MDSSFNTLPESQSTNQNTPEQYNSDNESINIITSSNNNYKDSIYNNPQYKLESNEDSSIYIFKNGLFTRSVLNIDVNKEREILISCTTCSYKKITTIKGFQSSNYVQHYKNKHPNIAYNEKTENKLIKRANLPLKTDFFNTTTTSDSRKRQRTSTIITNNTEFNNEFNEEEAYDKILDFIISNNLSFNILNSESFNNLLTYYNRLSPVINRWKIKGILTNTYNTYLSNLNTELQRNILNKGLFSLTFDIWTSSSQKSYLGIILSYIDNDFNLIYKLIGFEELLEVHSGLNIYTEFINIINSYQELSNNIISITRDNASNNNTFISIFKRNTTNKAVYDIRCSAHILNLVVQDILQDYLLNKKAENDINSYSDSIINNTANTINPDTNSNITITAKLRKLATHIKYTQENKKLFLEGINKYKNEGIIPLNYNITRIPLDNLTRWNSTYYMIKVALDLQKAIIYTANNTTNKDFKQNMLTETDWVQLKELKSIFEVFIKPTIKLQGQIYTTLNFSLLYIYQIYKKLNNLINIYKQNKTANSSFILAIQSGLEKLNKYYPQKVTPAILKGYYKPYILSIILDPRFKLIHFKNQGLLQFYPTIIDDITTILRFEYMKIKNAINPANNISFDELQDDIYNISEKSDSDDELYSKENNSEEEYIIYIKESPISQKEHPLDYWKLNNNRFPILSILARRYLAIPATSASIESTFSIGGNIITKSRNKLSSTTIKELILLKSWKTSIKRLEEIYKENRDEKEDIEEEN